MELLKKFGFWAWIIFLITLVMVWLTIFFKNLEGPVYILIALFLPALALVLSIIGLSKDKPNVSAKIALILSCLYFIFLLFFVFFGGSCCTLPRPASPTSCMKIGGTCFANCDDAMAQEGGFWAHNMINDGTAGGCQEGEACCVKITDEVPAE